MFLPDGEVVQAAEALYRRPVLLLRGSFDPVMRVHLKMMEQARRFSSIPWRRGKAMRTMELVRCPWIICCGARWWTRGFHRPGGRAQSLGSGAGLALPGIPPDRCDPQPLHERPMGIILSIGLLNELFKPKWAENLAGGLLESFGRLFKNDVTLYVFPWKNRRNGELVTAETFHAPDDSVHLYRHFLANGPFLAIPCEDDFVLSFTGRDVCRMISAKDVTLAAVGSRKAWTMAERHVRLDAPISLEQS